MGTTFKLMLREKRMKERSGTFPVILKVTHDRVPREFPTIYDLTSEDFKKLTASRVSAELQIVRDNLQDIVRETGNFLRENNSFDFEEFESKVVSNNVLFKPRKSKSIKIDQSKTNQKDFDFSKYHKRFPIFFEDHSKGGTISRAFLDYIKRLIQEERIGSALTYQNTYYSLKTFKGNVRFAEITQSYLWQYEKWMLGKECTLGTVGINLRPLRAVFNEQIEAGFLNRKKCYPFGKRKYVIPKSRNVKKAINIDAIGTLFYHIPEDANEKKAKDYWMFCYFANGMNPKDVAQLKFKDIDGDYFVFIRAKTERTARENPKPITVYINEDMKEIIQRLGNKENDPDNYVFPILERGMDPLEKHFMVRTFVKFINDRMKRIGNQLGISKKLTTIVSRHSFSTQLKRSGASTEMIQESLGHTDKATTENYLDSFENDIKKELSETLTAFKKDSLLSKKIKSKKAKGLWL